MEIDKNNNTNIYNNELNAIKELMLNINQRNLLSHINFIKGKITFYNKEFKLAKKYFFKLRDLATKNYWLGRCELKNNKLDKAKKYLIESKKNEEQYQNIFEVTSVDIYLALLESKTDLENASKTLSRCKKEFEEFEFTPKEYYEVLEEIGRDNVIIDTTDINIEKTDFFLEDLPTTLILDDSKEMILMKKGMSFYGKGNQELFTINRVVDEIEEMFEDTEYYKRYQDNIFLYDFYIDKECVTNQEYINYCKSAEIKIPSYLVGISKELLNDPICDKKLTIEDAKAYALYYGKELPLPQEWEKAFRGEKGSFSFKNSANKDLLTSYEMFELTDKYSFSGTENRFRNSSDKYKLTDTFSKKDTSKKFIFRCVKPIFSVDDLK